MSDWDMPDGAWGELTHNGHGEDATDEPMAMIEGGKGNELQAVRDAAQKLAEARVMFAEHFVLAKAKWKGSQPLTDRTAHEMTVSATKDEITVLDAEYQIALHLMRSNPT